MLKDTDSLFRILRIRQLKRLPLAMRGCKMPRQYCPLFILFLALLRSCSAALFYQWAVCESSRLFLYDFELKDDGCRILCIYLNSSSDTMHSMQFLDYSFTRDYDLEESEDCKMSKMSQVCVQILTAAFKTPQNKPLSFNITFNGKSHIADANSSTFNRASYKQEFCFPTEDLQLDHEIKITPVKDEEITILNSFMDMEKEIIDGSFRENPVSFRNKTLIHGMVTSHRESTRHFLTPIWSDMAPPVSETVVIRTKSVMENGENATITTHDVGSARVDVMVTFKNKKKN